jgi:UDP-2,3-diacylglucosamine pyrophosphatase LpxH
MFSLSSSDLTQFPIFIKKLTWTTTTAGYNHASRILEMGSTHEGSVRICGDYKVTANRAVLPDWYPLPKLKTLLLP